MKQNVWTKYTRYVYASDSALDKSIEARRRDDLHRTIHFFTFSPIEEFPHTKQRPFQYTSIRIIGIFFFSQRTKERKAKRETGACFIVFCYLIVKILTRTDMYPRYIRYRLFVFKETNRKKYIYIYRNITHEIKTASK